MEWLWWTSSEGTGSRPTTADPTASRPWTWAIAVGAQWLPYTGPDRSEWPPLNYQLAIAYQQRWHRAAQPTDADHAIDHWRAVLAENDTDDWAATNCGSLLVERAHRDGRLADATDAVPLIESGTLAVGDDPVAAERWYRLGTAHHASWQLGQIPGSLDAALRCLDEALRRGAANDDDLLKIHLERALVGMSAWDHEQRPPDEPASALAARLRGFVDEACEALAATPAATPDLRADVAGRLAYIELSLAPYEPGGIDLERIGALVAGGAGAEHRGADWRFLMTAAQAMRDYWATIDQADDGAAPSLDALAQLAVTPGLSANVQALLGPVVRGS
ncbi:MAG TPA: hypothetical protein VFC00_19965 [Micromonosporaceae bacterium]|nr:hypothetical protein [Micromonosporaceae bacterium]